MSRCPTFRPVLYDFEQEQGRQFAVDPEERGRQTPGEPLDNTMLLESTPRKIVAGNVPQNALGSRNHGMQTNLDDGSSIDARTHEFATRPALLRKALEFHHDWIETTLGVALADVVIFQVDLNLAQIGVEKILACSSRPDASRAVRRLRPLVASADIPHGFPPLVELSKLPHKVDLAAVLQGMQTGGRLSLEWHDCPVAMRLHGLTAPVIAFNLYYHSGPGSNHESAANLLITRRECAKEVVRLVEDVGRRDSQPRLHVLGERPRRIVSCVWDELVLDQRVLSLLRDDFESFFERETWFRENRLPFRRGYLLHGPPGNGKSTAIRAMMTSRGLTAHTLRLFDSNTDDSSFDALFDQALKERPSMIVLEDLDRAFPKTGETKSRVVCAYSMGTALLGSSVSPEKHASNGPPPGRSDKCSLGRTSNSCGSAPSKPRHSR
jgi:hypothetical protein